MAMNPVPRSADRLASMMGKDLRRGERIRAALPVWIGGTYVPFLGSIIVAVALAAGMASGLGAGGLVFAAGGAMVGAVVGRWVAKRAAADHPVDARALQVFIGVTDRRFLVFEPKTWGKPAALLTSFPVKEVADVRLFKGGFIRPSRLHFLSPQGEHVYEFSGLWDVEELIAALQ